MGLTATRIKLVLWKNFKIRGRNPLRTVLEIFWPICLFGVIVSLRTLTELTMQKECHYSAYAMPSAGLIPWIQSIACNLNTPCHEKQTATERFGQVRNKPKNYDPAQIELMKNNNFSFEKVVKSEKIDLQIRIDTVLGDLRLLMDQRKNDPSANNGFDFSSFLASGSGPDESKTGEIGQERDFNNKMCKRTTICDPDELYKEMFKFENVADETVVGNKKRATFLSKYMCDKDFSKEIETYINDIQVNVFEAVRPHSSGESDLTISTCSEYMNTAYAKINKLRGKTGLEVSLDIPQFRQMVQSDLAKDGNSTILMAIIGGAYAANQMASKADKGQVLENMAITNSTLKLDEQTRWNMLLENIIKAKMVVSSDESNQQIDNFVDQFQAELFCESFHESANLEKDLGLTQNDLSDKKSAITSKLNSKKDDLREKVKEFKANPKYTARATLRGWCGYALTESLLGPACAMTDTDSFKKTCASKTITPQVAQLCALGNPTGMFKDEPTTMSVLENEEGKYTELEIIEAKTRFKESLICKQDFFNAIEKFNLGNQLPIPINQDFCKSMVKNSLSKEDLAAQREKITSFMEFTPHIQALIERGFDPLDPVEDMDPNDESNSAENKQLKMDGLKYQNETYVREKEICDKNVKEQNDEYLKVCIQRKSDKQVQTCLDDHEDNLEQDKCVFKNAMDDCVQEKLKSDDSCVEDLERCEKEFSKTCIVSVKGEQDSVLENCKNSVSTSIIEKTCTSSIETMCLERYNIKQKTLTNEYAKLEAKQSRDEQFKFTCGMTLSKMFSGPGGLTGLLKTLQENRGSGGGGGLSGLGSQIQKQMGIDLGGSGKVVIDGSVFDDADKPDLFDDDENVCSLIQNLQKTTEMEMVWKMVKPLVTGQIIYYPATKQVEKIIDQARSMFQVLADIKNFAKNWTEKYSEELKNKIKSDNGEAQCGRDLLEINQVQVWADDYLENGGLLKDRGMKNQTGVDFKKVVKFLKIHDGNPNFSKDESLSNWEPAIERLNQYAKAAVEILSCIQLEDRFVAYGGPESNKPKHENWTIEKKEPKLNKKTCKVETETIYEGLADMAQQKSKHRQLLAVIEFDDAITKLDTTKLLKEAKEIVYSIRMTSDAVMSPITLKPSSWKPGAKNEGINMNYINRGFLFVQDLIDHAIIRTAKKENWEEEHDIKNIKMNNKKFLKLGQNGKMTEEFKLPLAPHFSTSGSWLQEMPYPCYKRDEFLSTTGDTLPIMLTMAWIYTVAMLVKDIVQEKESRLKEVMRMMGMSDIIHWFGWFVVSFTTVFATVIMLSILLKFGGILPNSNMLCVILWLSSFGVSSICVSFLISAVFSKANLAAACGSIIYFMMHTPYGILENWDTYLGPFGKRAWSLISSVAFGYGCTAVGELELHGDGLQWHTMGYVTTPTRLSFGETIVFLWIDSLLYCLLTWYIETVWPGEFGISRPWYFLFTPSYWRDVFDIRREKQFGLKAAQTRMRPANLGAVRHESEPKDAVLGAAILDLSKKYGTSTNSVYAVKDLNINFYEGQITALLGHNGAGKTTSMSIMCGLFPPTQGTVYINGYDIRTEIKDIRKSLGFCPQHNVLFENLTVEEHIWFYACLKGTYENAVDFKEELEVMLEETGLSHRRGHLPSQLSGGMKRKLSVATAFVGGSKTIILDEPTAGVDPYARRGIWDLLTRYKRGKTIILCTHHMDEADILGDRIAIMSAGRLLTVGSSHWLKCQYGDGYQLTMVKAKAVNNGSQELLNSNFEANVPSEHAMRAVQGFCPDANLYEDTSTEITFTLPFASRANNMFTKLFRFLDQTGASLGITTYGIKDTTLEQIFLRVTGSAGGVNGKEKDTMKPVVSGKTYAASKNSRISAKDNAPKYKSVTGTALLVQQFKALFMRRYYNSLRSKKGLMSQIVLPPFFVLITLLLMKMNKLIPVEDVKLELDSGLYANADVINHPDINSFYQVENKTDDFQCTDNNCRIFNYFPKRETADINPMPTFDLPNCTKTHLEQISTARGESNRLNNTDALFCLRSIAKILDGTESEPLGAGDESLIDDDSQAVCPIDGKFGVGKYPVGAYDEGVKGQSWDYMKSYMARKGQQIYFTVDKDEKWITEDGFNVKPGSKETEDRHRIFIAEHMQISDWVVKTEGDFKMERFGGVSLDAVNHLAPEQGDFDGNKIYFLAYNKLAQMASFQQTSMEDMTKSTQQLSSVLMERKAYKAWFMNAGYHSSAIYLNTINNGQLKEVEPELSIKTYNHPYSFRKTMLSSKALIEATMQSMLAISVIFAMSVVPSSFVIFLIEERRTGSKHLESLSGVPPWLYWITNFAWDILNYTVAVILVGILFMIFGDDCFTAGSNFVCLMLLLMLFGWAIIPMMYPFSFLFDLGSTAYVILTCGNLFVGLLTTVITLILQMLGTVDPGIVAINGYLNKIFFLLPHYCLGRGMVDMAISGSVNKIREEFELEGLYADKALNWDIAGAKIFALVIQGFGFFIITMLIEYSTYFLKKSWDNAGREKQLNEMTRKQNMDDDVKSEINRITSAVSTPGLTPNSETGSAAHFFNEKEASQRLKGAEDKNNHDFNKNFAMEGVNKNIGNSGLGNKPNRPGSLSINSKGPKRPSNLSIGTGSGPPRAGSNKHNLKSPMAAAKPDEITVFNLSKVYGASGPGLFNLNAPGVLAVDRISFGVPSGQCFGLLGVNGAGKSTTFKMLTGDIGASEGDAYICGNSIRENLQEAQKNIGYCPQTNAIFSLLTAREHLEFYAKLRGIHPDYVKPTVDWALRKLALEKYQDAPAGTYSGGNKRKLCVGIALVGAPKVVFLDEPTAGMDPGTRRFLWDCVLDLVKNNHSVVMTSHSMEECEVLCSRLAIMVNGQFQCIGPPQHLKNRFGEGYTLTIRVADENMEMNYDYNTGQFITKSTENLAMRRPYSTTFEDDDFVKIDKLVRENIRGAILKEQHANTMQYQLPAKGLKLADVFSIIEDHRESHRIMDYSLSQTTLDDVFVTFAKRQKDDPTDKEEGENEELEVEPSKTEKKEAKKATSKKQLKEDLKKDSKNPDNSGKTGKIDKKMDPLKITGLEVRPRSHTLTRQGTTSVERSGSRRPTVSNPANSTSTKPDAQVEKAPLINNTSSNNATSLL